MQMNIIWWSKKHSSPRYVTSLGLNSELILWSSQIEVFYLYFPFVTLWWNYNNAVKWSNGKHILKGFWMLCVCVCVVGVCQWQAKSRYSSRLDTVCKRLVSTDHFDQSFAGPALLVCTVIITMLMNGDRVSSNSRPLFWQPPTANRRARSRDLH